MSICYEMKLIAPNLPVNYESISVVSDDIEGDTCFVYKVRTEVMIGNRYVLVGLYKPWLFSLVFVFKIISTFLGQNYFLCMC